MESRIQNSESRRTSAKTFEDLIVWQEAHAWVLAICRFTESFPKSELCGLVSQVRRAAVSIPATFAEGFKKRGGKDKLRFFNIAQGSVEESRYYLILSKDRGYGDSSGLLVLLEEVSRLLDSYYRTIPNSGF